MKRFLSLILAILMLVVATGCQKPNNNENSTSQEENKSQLTSTENKEDGKVIRIVSTIYAPYDWTRELLKDCKDNYQIDYLLENGRDLHSYQASAEDLVKISEADMVLHVGGPADEWLEKALENSSQPNLKKISLMKVLSDDLLKEELVAGMQNDHDHDDHDHDSDEHKDHGHDDHDHEGHTHGTYDEHLWLSLENAEKVVEKIAEELKSLTNIDKDQIEANKEAYEKKLDDLDDRFERLFDNNKNAYLLFADRFPFRYLANDYKVPYSAAFPGCSADSKASFKTIAFLADKVNELDLKNVFVIEASDQSVAKSVIENSKKKGVQIRVLHSMQIMNEEDKAKGYLGLMEENYKNLSEGLK